MTSSGVLPIAVVKEFRALAPTWAAVLSVIILTSLNDGTSPALIPLGLLGCALGGIALGAQSMGHEYSQRTLVLLLSQPIDRRRLFLYKAAVLVTMVGALIAVTLWRFADPLSRVPDSDMGPNMLVLAAVCGVSIAPWLTMVCRSALAGGVFAIALLGTLFTSLNVLGALIYGLGQPAAIDRFISTFFWPLTWLACAGSAVAAWRTFIRLEAIEGGHAEFQMPGAQAGTTLAGATARPQSILRALAAKELRLQQMAYLAAVVFTVLWIGLAWREHLRPGEIPFVPVSVLYGGVLSLLIGSLTSAQERELGTLEWQTLQPVAGWQQWAIKIGVAATLTLTFGVALPIALSVVTGTNERFAAPIGLWAVCALGLMALGTYLSSLCRSSVAALVLSLPSVVALVALFRTVGSYIPRLGLREGPLVASMETLMVAGILGLTAVLVWLAGRNHPRADAIKHRLLTQVPAIAGYVVIVTIALALVG